MTLGEYRVGVTFNPSNDDMVAKIKRVSAELIDLVASIDAHKNGPNPEVMRLKSLAQTHAETAAMWAVKAATKPEWESTP